jgi:hypothetical protein
MTTSAIRCVMVKISGEALAGGTSEVFSDRAILHIAQKLLDLQRHG